MKQAVPPIKLDMGSARNTPLTPSPAICGSMRVSGMTIITFRKREKKTAFLDRPSDTKVDCPENCRDIMKNPKK